MRIVRCDRCGTDGGTRAIHSIKSDQVPTEWPVSDARIVAYLVHVDLCSDCIDELLAWVYGEDAAKGG